MTQEYMGVYFPRYGVLLCLVRHYGLFGRQEYTSATPVFIAKHRGFQEGLREGLVKELCKGLVEGLGQGTGRETWGRAWSRGSGEGVGEQGGRGREGQGARNAWGQGGTRGFTLTGTEIQITWEVTNGVYTILRVS